MNARPSHRDLSPDAVRLKAVRAALLAIAPGDWTRAHDEQGGLLEARGEMGELLVLARFEPVASADEIAFACEAPDTVRFLLRLLDEAFAKIRELSSASRAAGAPAGRALPRSGVRPAAGPPEASNPRNFAAECAMKCQEPAFKVFLHEAHGLERPLTDERVVQKVRSLLGVQSRNELNDGGRAGEAWKALRAAFAAWLKAGR
ncbi:hypothetical protein [Mesorhizobium sp. B1-1-2]|uniref:hypothetical protein n=1 Tax=Mesorhizobium sp. B1-1-2 TaxID=2589982 RepID=UPI0011290DA7|nr:hypothetical protein [Mesorhizobium sp. B1-1-2]TPN79978.1 hypothetical protein FJ985_01735 [Mesorhizobium sp. B1-1-2]